MGGQWFHDGEQPMAKIECSGEGEEVGGGWEEVGDGVGASSKNDVEIENWRKFNAFFIILSRTRELNFKL